MLDRLDLNVQHNLGVVNEQIERELAKRCREMNLSEALDRSPVCPVCGLRLGEELNLRPVAEIEEMARAGVSEYVRALASPANQRALAEYIRTLPHRGDTVRKLAQLVRLPQDTGARGLMPLLGDDVLTHPQRALTGQQVRARSLSELRSAGRTLTRSEIMEVLEEWVAGDDKLDENDLLHLSPDDHTGVRQNLTGCRETFRRAHGLNQHNSSISVNARRRVYHPKVAPLSASPARRRSPGGFFYTRLSVSGLALQNGIPCPHSFISVARQAPSSATSRSLSLCRSASAR